VVVAPAAPVAAPAALTPEGIGPLKIGMTPEAAADAGAPLAFQAGYAPERESCVYGRSDALPGVRVMVENQRVARVDLEPGSAVTTDKGLGLGATAAAVRAAYGDSIEQSGHKYVESPAAYLENWNRDRSRGVRYETDREGRVTAVYAGGQAVNYIEGCA
jgi:hypothetical protein